MKILEFKKDRIGRRKSESLVDKSTTQTCVLDVRAIQEARILAEEYKRIGGGKVDVSELAKQISSDYQASNRR